MAGSHRASSAASSTSENLSTNLRRIVQPSQPPRPSTTGGICKILDYSTFVVSFIACASAKEYGLLWLKMVAFLSCKKEAAGTERASRFFSVYLQRFLPLLNAWHCQLLMVYNFYIQRSNVARLLNLKHNHALGGFTWVRFQARQILLFK